jgi:hypothetical protein
MNRLTPMQRMLADIEREVAFTRTMIGKDALDARVMEVMAQVPREHFVPDGTGDAMPMTMVRCPSAMVRPSPSPISWH